MPLAAALLATLISAFGLRARPAATVVASGEPADRTADELPASR